MARKVIRGVNDFETKFPKLATEWHPVLNGKLKPYEVYFGSYSSAWWKCSKCGREWKTQIKNRAIGQGKCPYCSHQKTIVGVNDLKSLFPDLCFEWDYEKNEKDPSEYFPHSNKKVWWVCSKCGNQWNTAIGSRVRGSGCPKCGRKKQIEKRIEDLINSNGSLGEKRPDLLMQWNYEKNEGIDPFKITLKSNKKYWWICEKGHEWQASASYRARGRGCPECSGSGTSFPEQCIYYYLSKVIEAKSRIKIDGFEFDIFLPSLNCGIEYDGFYFHSTEKAKHHEDEKNLFALNKKIRLIRIKETKEFDEISVVNDVIFYPPDNYKSFDVVIRKLFDLLGINYKDEVFDIDSDRIHIYEQYLKNERENSIATKRPSLLEEWDYEKNGNIKPEYIDFCSNLIVWWKCGQCHNSWKAPVYSREVGNGCPYCSNKILLKGFNDLKTLNPSFMKDWDYEKNTIDPSNLLGAPKIEAWWKCHKCGFSWKTTIDKRNQGRNCPQCGKINSKINNLKNRIAKKGSLQDLYPNLALEWDNVKNDAKPDSYLPGSGMKVWWVCPICGESYQAIIKNRVKSHTKCPKCSKKRLIRHQSIIKERPDLLSIWDYSKNMIDPSFLTICSAKKVFWRCPKCKNSWEAPVSRVAIGYGCPKCNGGSVKKVRCIETNKIYKSVKEASRETGISMSAISAAARGDRKTGGKYHWEYA